MTKGVRLGITGHRHLADPAAASAAMEGLIARLTDLLEPVLGSGSWVAVSPLAKGADRIFAETILRRPGSRLEVITPFPLDDYRKDFVEPDDRAGFESLLARAESLEELPFVRAGDDTRHAGYRAVGERVVERCEILVAYWDGRPAAGTGGTAEIVAHALAIGRPLVWIDASVPRGDAVVLAATGSGRGDPPGAVRQPLDALLSALPGA